MWGYQRLCLTKPNRPLIVASALDCLTLGITEMEMPAVLVSGLCHRMRPLRAELEGSVSVEDKEKTLTNYLIGQDTSPGGGGVTSLDS